MKLPTRTGLLVFFLALYLLAGCGGDSESRNPGMASFTVNIQDRQIEQTQPLQVQRGQSVSLYFRSDEPGQVHIHGYDLRSEFAAGTDHSIEFVADYPGRFAVAFHPAKSNATESGHDHSGHDHKTESRDAHSENEAILGYIEVNP